MRSRAYPMVDVIRDGPSDFPTLDGKGKNRPLLSLAAPTMRCGIGMSRCM